MVSNTVLEVSGPVLLANPEINIIKIIELYNQGIGSFKLAKQFNLKPKKIRNLLKEAGVKLRSSGPANTDKVKKLEKQILELYIDRISSEKIAKQFNIDGCTVCRVLKRNGIKIRPDSENKRKYKLNDTWLDNIDTEEKAYFYGFMLTDGNVDKDENSFALTLNDKDEHILKQFSNILYGFEKIYYWPYTLESGEVHISAGLRVYSKKMAKRLIELGCVPNKTFITKYPDWLNPELTNHFIRGLIDGDGGIHLSQTRSRVTLTGTIELLKAVKNVFNFYIPNFNCSIIDEAPGKNNIATLWITNIGIVKRTLDWLYGNAAIFLKRKYKNYERTIEFFYSLNNIKYSKEQIDKIEFLFKENKDIVTISNEVDISSLIVQRFLQRLGYGKDDFLNEVATLYNKGISVPKIADQLNVSNGAVYRRLKKNNIKLEQVKI